MIVLLSVLIFFVYFQPTVPDFKLSDYKSKLLLRHSKIYFLKYRYLPDLQNEIFIIFNDNTLIFITED